MNSALIVRLGSLGDVVHAIPVASALRHAFPQARIDWMVDPRYVELLDMVDAVDRRVPLDPRALSSSGASALLRTVRELKAARYDAVIDLQGLLKSAVLARAVRGRRTIGFPKAHLREPLARVFYTLTPDPGHAAHVIYKNLALLAPLGVRDRRLRFSLKVPETAASQLVRQRLGPGGYVVINPGAAWPNKRWSPAKFGAVAAAIRDQHAMRSLVLWGPGEEPLARAVVEASSGAGEVSPPTTITDVVAIARSAQLMISGDTGPLHLAGAVDTPIVALFGPTKPERNGPWGLYDIAISRVDTCACVYARRCRRGMPCIDDIDVQEVLEAVRRRLNVHV